MEGLKAVCFNDNGHSPDYLLLNENQKAFWDIRVENKSIAEYLFWVMNP